MAQRESEQWSKNGEIPRSQSPLIIATITAEGYTIDEEPSADARRLQDIEGNERSLKTREKCMEGLSKYMKYQQSQDRKKKSLNILLGHRPHTQIARPGEFVVAQVDSKRDLGKERKRVPSRGLTPQMESLVANQGGQSLSSRGQPNTQSSINLLQKQQPQLIGAGDGPDMKNSSRFSGNNYRLKRQNTPSSTLKMVKAIRQGKMDQQTDRGNQISTSQPNQLQHIRSLPKLPRLPIEKLSKQENAQPNTGRHTTMELATDSIIRGETAQGEQDPGQAQVTLRSTRSIRCIMQLQENGKLIQSSRLLHNTALRTSKEWENQGYSALPQSQSMKSLQNWSANQNIGQIPQKSSGAGTDVKPTRKHYPTVQDETTAQDGKPVQSSKKSRFIERIGQNASRNSEMLTLETDSQKKMDPKMLKQHSYRISQQQPKVQLKSQIFNPKIPKKDPLVTKQQEMIRNRDAQSPFLTMREGGNAMNLAQGRRQLSQSNPSAGPSIFVANPDKFLALELFDPLYEVEEYSQLIQEMRDLTTQKCFAKSKWIFTDNKPHEMKRCEVLEYIQDKEQFVIRWEHNQQPKKVSRFNLVFEKEDEDKLRQRIQRAKQQRELGMQIMQYHYTLDQIKINNPVPLPDQIKTRISYRIISLNAYHRFKSLQLPIDQEENKLSKDNQISMKKLFKAIEVDDNTVEKIHSDFRSKYLSFVALGALFEEVDLDYKRCARISSFEAELPYSQENFAKFSTILPMVKFLPVSEKTLGGPSDKKQIKIDDRDFKFKELFARMSKKILQGTEYKREILTRVNREMADLQEANFFVLKFKHAQDIAGFVEQNGLVVDHVFARIRDHMQFTEYELAAFIAKEANRINTINEERRKATSHKSKKWDQVFVDPAFHQEIGKLQRVLNMKYESGLRECFTNSLEKFKSTIQKAHHHFQESLQKPLDKNAEITMADIELISHDEILNRRICKECFQLNMTLKFNKTAGQIELNPSPSEIRDAFVQLITDLILRLSEVPSLFLTETGHARGSLSERFSKVFPDCQAYFEKEEIAFVEGHLQNILKIPCKVIAIVSDIINSMSESPQVLAADTKDYSAWLKSQDINVYARELANIQSARDQIEKLLFEDQLMLGPVVLNCKTLKERLLKKIEAFNQQIFIRVKKQMAQKSKAIYAEVSDICEMLQKEKFRDIEELTETKEKAKDLPNNMQGLKRTLDEINEHMALLESNHCKQTEEEMHKIMLTFSEPLRIHDHELDARERIETLEKKFLEELGEDTETLAKESEEIKQEFEILQGFENSQEHDLAASCCDKLEKKLGYALARSKVYNRRQKLFDVKITDYTELRKIDKQFDPYNKLWGYAREIDHKKRRWMGGHLNEIDRDEITAEITDASRTLLKLGRQDFKERRAIAQIAIDLRKAYEDFRTYLPLICALRSPHLKNRHWQSIIRLREPPLEIDFELNQSLEDIIKMGALHYVEEINEISHFASRERKLEQQVQAMKDEWRRVEFDLVEFRDSGTYLLHKPEPIWELLDEHILKTMVIASSPYVKFLQSEVNFWKQMLIRVQDILEEWGKVQRGWLYLQPIFGSSDIMDQLPVITNQFQTVDKIWRTTMSSTKMNPNVLDACFQGRLVDTFISCNETLERVQRGLSEYLTQKRLKFPRFFFLPNDDLLQILSKVKEPQRVQPYLNKIFEGISRVSLSEEAGEVSGMSSSLGEHVQFVSVVPIRELIEINEESSQEEKSSARTRKEWGPRKVEEWLQDVEDQMRYSLRQQFKQSKKDQTSAPRDEWLLKWPGQVTQSLDQCRWTQSVEIDGFNQLKGGKVAEETAESGVEDPKPMRTVLEEESKLLAALVTLTRQQSSSARHSQTLGALIVLMVHSKDVIVQLIDNNVKDPQDFEWIQNLRYYIFEEMLPKEKILQLEVEARMITSNRRYGFEYLGNQPRLVITPLTDRCYRTLMVALQLSLGGAPEGPAGTGKTETTKDLAKALAKQCIVFNCSDQIDVETMSKFFKGLACCGAWACFDEFNRIEIEVLSVIASQIQQIQTALLRKRPRAPFIFEETNLMMDPTCAVFITMNPGYAGRSELPDNLKNLFRPVAMMVPNYAQIAEILLYSFGFQMARALSVKVTTCLKLMSEQLSTQTHYDYGMRAVKSIISAAGRHKALSPDDEDEQIACRCLSESSLPKLVAEDVPLFEAIISDLFPGINLRLPDQSKLTAAIQNACEERNLECTEEVTAKALQLNATILVRHGLMLVGETMSGKTQIMQTLGSAVDKLNEERSVKIDIINPKAVTIGQLYGDFDPLTHEWSDGILARVVRESAADESQDLHWIMLDGPVDAVWVENLNTVLDDNKKLCLPSGEIIKYSDQMTMMFEVEDLFEASPATVSRCGMVYLTPSKLGWQVQIQPWIRNLPNSLKADFREQLLAKLIDDVLPQILDWLFNDQDKSLLVHQSIAQNQLVKQFLNLLEAFLLKEHTRQSLAIKEQEDIDKKEAQEERRRLEADDFGNKRRGVAGTDLQAMLRGPDPKGKKGEKTELVNLFLMAAAWGFGASLSSEESQVQLNELILKQALLNPEVSKLQEEEYPIPTEGMNIFDFYFDFKEKKWNPWNTISRQKNDKKEDAVDKTEDDITLTEKNTTQDDADNASSFLFVQTDDTIRFTFLMKQLTRRAMPICLLGGTGTGKTSVAKGYLSDAAKAGEADVGQLVFSATTSTSFFQAFFESKLEKQRKGVYGPKIQGSNLLLFIDDMGMPQRQKYGAQPTLELVRQIMADRAWYDLKDTSVKQVVGAVFVGAMGLPGGGRKLPTNRLLRHFSIFYLPEIQKNTLAEIYSKILQNGLRDHNEAWQRRADALITISIELYLRVKTRLLPTPANSHYVFNVRQLTELIQGILIVQTDVIARADNKVMLLQKLWLHESRRVFSDRLTNQADSALFETIMKDAVMAADKNFISSTLLEDDAEPIMFCNFAEVNSVDYRLVISNEKLMRSLADVIQRYNAAHGKRPLLGIQFFSYMIEHLSRISRILQKPQGHGLLVSLNGNGRRTLIELAAFINEYQVFKVEITPVYGRNDWVDEMKTLFKNSGIDRQDQVFVVTIEQAQAAPGAIDDVCSIANLGEIPNLFGVEDIEEIQGEISKTNLGLAGQKALELFQQRCKEQIHLLISASPASEDLRENLRKYPSLVNCTSIDWFLQWPDEALISISKAWLDKIDYLKEWQKLKDQEDKQAKEDKQDDAQREAATPDRGPSSVQLAELDGIDGLSDQARTGEDGAEASPQRERVRPDPSAPPEEQLAHLFVEIYSSAVSTAELYENERDRSIFLSPAKLNEVFPLFENLLNSKASRLVKEREQFQAGITKLDEANETIDKLKDSLQALGPILEEKSQAVEASMKRLEVEAKDVEKVEEAVGEEASRVADQKKVAEEIQYECEVRLNEAQPEYEAAILALRTLKVNDFVTMKSFNQPPQPIRLALEAACIMLGIKPKMVDQEVGKGGKKVKVPDYWGKSKKLLNDYKKFIASMESYDKDNIPPERIEEIQKYLNDPEFVPEKIRKASEAAEGICKWVIAVCKYEKIAKEVRPLKADLAKAQAQVHQTEQELATKQEELDKIKAKRDQLEAELADQKQERENLVNKRDDSQAKLKRATALMESLGSEKELWLQKIKSLRHEQVAVVGDMALAVSIVNYAGPFEATYRKRLVEKQWAEIFQQYGELKQSTYFDFCTVVGDAEHIQRWQIQGIPNDSVSIENMVILEKTEATKWPLLIDPQEQALKFMREYLDHDYRPVKVSDQKFVQSMEVAITQGQAVICQNVGDLTDSPTLLSLLDRDVQIISRQRYIQVGDRQVPYHADFRLILFTNLSNPKIKHQTQSKIQMLNFLATQEGLSEQLLSLVCKSECSKEEDEKLRLKRQDLEFKLQKQKIEAQILQLLRDAGDDILENDVLLSSLNESKSITDDIQQKLDSAQLISARIEESRRAYRPVAVHGSRLFFLIQSLQALDPIYQFSMNWFRGLFKESLATSDEDTRQKDYRRRVLELKQNLRRILFESVSQTLFDHHQVAFAFLLAVKVHEMIDGVLADNVDAMDFKQRLKQLDNNQRASEGSSSHTNRLSGMGGLKTLQRRKSSVASFHKPGSQKKSDTNSQAGRVSVRRPTAALAPLEDERFAVQQDLLRYMMTGILRSDGAVEAREIPEPCQDFIDERKWTRILELATFECFESLPEEIERDPEIWKKFMEEQNYQSLCIPESITNEDSVSLFSEIVLVKTLRPELAIDAIKGYIRQSLGSEFDKPTVQPLREIYAERGEPSSPIMLLITPGNDPMEAVMRLAEEKQRIPYQVSLGKGQSAKAKALIAEVRQYGGWVVLQNCHLAPSFMPELAQIIDKLQPQIQTRTMGGASSSKKDEKEDQTMKPPHQEFRLWLTTMSTTNIPNGILQSSIKLSSGSEKGIKPTMQRTLTQIMSSKPDRELDHDSTKPKIWRSLLLQLILFHAIIRERRKFGALGWNCHYDFNDSDFHVSMRQLHLLIESFHSLPFNALKYLTGQCNYGGRVTDDKDRRTLVTLLDDFYSADIITDDGSEQLISGDHLNPLIKDFKADDRPELEHVLNFVNEMPENNSPEHMGLHPSAMIDLALIGADSVAKYVLLSQKIEFQKTGSSQGGKSHSSNLSSQITRIENINTKVREEFDTNQIKIDFPFDYQNSMNVVLVQEVLRFNRLLKVIHTTLHALTLALQGQAVATQEIEQMHESINQGQVPAIWVSRAYSSLKPLGSWIDDLEQRTKMLDAWILAKTLPSVLWISGLSFPASLLTAVKQDYARKYEYPIDWIELEAEIDGGVGSSHAERTYEGCHWINGLYIQGARWVEARQLLDEKDSAKDRQYTMPAVLLKPRLRAGSGQQRREADLEIESLYEESHAGMDPYYYECPVYQTSKRAGTLSTTGHSTNFVMNISVPSLMKPNHWIKRGTAIILATDD